MNIPNDMRVAAQYLLNYSVAIEERAHGFDDSGEAAKVARVASILLSRAETVANMDSELRALRTGLVGMIRDSNADGAIVYDLSQAEAMESAVSNKLIAMGWTPPAR